METTVLDDLRKNKTTPCVSVIVPTHTTAPDRQLDELEVKKMLERAEDLVKHKFGKKNSGEEVIKKLYALAKKIDYIHNGKGIGVFVSPEVARLVKFPFPVVEKVVVGNNFEIRDILFLSETMMNYYLLAINEKVINLFEGKGIHLKQVIDHNFPLHLENDYEYTHTSLGSSYGYALKSPEKGRSVMKEQRWTTFLKKADKRVSEYLDENRPLIIGGNSKMLGSYAKMSVNKKSIVGKIWGDYVHEDLYSLGEMAFEQIRSYLKEKEEKLLMRLQDAVGKKLAMSGITDVWNAAFEGKGLILLVEKDFAMPGFVEDETSKFHLHPPHGNHQIISDAADDAMELVIEKKGKVVIVENGKLDDHGKIALILRYW
ncbi:MAG: hypothetical protein PSX36_09890 [bacterium]|nr:hypothetical protein [bacterium]